MMLVGGSVGSWLYLHQCLRLMNSKLISYLYKLSNHPPPYLTYQFSNSLYLYVKPNKKQPQKSLIQLQTLLPPPLPILHPPRLTQRPILAPPQKLRIRLARDQLDTRLFLKRVLVKCIYFSHDKLLYADENEFDFIMCPFGRIGDGGRNIYSCFDFVRDIDLLYSLYNLESTSIVLILSLGFIKSALSLEE